MAVLENILSVSCLTFASRIFGLLRDILIFAHFGISELNSAFWLAFSIPNLFRRLLGEGSLTSALIPVFADVYHKDGKYEAFSLLNKVTSRLINVLLLIVIGGILFCFFWLKSGMLDSRWKLCILFSAILLPYMFFICLGALFAAILNIFGKFLLHASNSIWLNLSMIVALLIGYFIPEEWRIYGLCGGVIVGGIIQMISLGHGLMRLGWQFHFDFKYDQRITEIRRLFLPGIIGTSTVQLNTAISRALAYFVSGSAVSILYLANRFVELPLGLFVAAVTTVIFPLLSNLEASNQRSLLREEFQRGAFLLLMIIFPAGIGLMSLDQTILSLFFRWKNFTASDIALVLPVLRIFLLALPFYALSAYLIRGYHCKKNTAKPAIISIIHFTVNTGLTLSFMFWLESIGIAFANLLAAILQTILLYIGLRRQYDDLCFKIWTAHFRTIILASIVMGLVVLILDHFLALYFFDKIHNLISIGVNVPLGVVLYFSLLYILGGRQSFQGLDAIWEKMRQKIARHKT